MNKKYYYTYKITLLVGEQKDHYYYGKHSTNNLDDNYRGSGRILVHYYRKYGHIENKTYKKEILQFFKNDEELNEAERNLIGELYKTDPLCLNLKQGGGYDDNTSYNISKAKNNIIMDDLWKKHISIGTKRGMDNPETRKKCSENAKRTKNFKGHNHTEESKEIIRIKKRGNKCALGHILNDEQKLNVSIGTKKAMNKPEVKKKMSDAKRGKHWKLVNGKRVWY